MKIREKGYIILLKTIHEALGIDEGDEVIVEIKDGIVFKPVKRCVNVEELRESLRRYVEVLKKVLDGVEPKPSELSRVHLEEEFN